MTKDTILFYMRSKADRSQLNLSQETKKVKKYNKWEKKLETICTLSEASVTYRVGQKVSCYTVIDISKARL